MWFIGLTVRLHLSTHQAQLSEGNFRHTDQRHVLGDVRHSCQRLFKPIQLTRVLSAVKRSIIALFLFIRINGVCPPVSCKSLAGAFDESLSSVPFSFTTKRFLTFCHITQILKDSLRCVLNLMSWNSVNRFINWVLITEMPLCPWWVPIWLSFSMHLEDPWCFVLKLHESHRHLVPL